MHPKSPSLFSGFGTGCLFVILGIYGLAYMYFRPEKKMSDMITNKQYRWFLIFLVVGGALLAISDIVFPDK